MTECAISQLELFHGPNYQTSIEGSSYKCFDQGSSADNQTIIFEIPSVDQYTDPSSIFLNFQVSIQKYDSTNGTGAFLVEADEIGPVNNFMSSLFSSITVSLNGNEIENSNDKFPYKAYLENLLNYNSESTRSYLSSCMYMPDEIGKFDVFSNATPSKPSTSLLMKAITPKIANSPTVEEAAINELITVANISMQNDNLFTSMFQNKFTHYGYQARRDTFVRNKIVELHGALHCDLTNSNLFLPPHVDIKISMKRSDPLFCLCGNSNDKFITKIHKASLYIKRLDISPNVALAQSMTLERISIKIPYIRREVKDFSIPAGLTSYTISKTNQGTLPTLVVFGLVEGTAFTGNHKKNPFNFQHFNVSSIQPMINEQSIPFKEPLDLDFSKNIFYKGYDTLIKGFNPLNEKFGNGLTPEAYIGGNTIYAFNLTSENCSDLFNVKKTGDVEIKLKFAEATKTVITAVLYYYYENLIQIDKRGQVTDDFSV